MKPIIERLRTLGYPVALDGAAEIERQAAEIAILRAALQSIVDEANDLARNDMAILTAMRQTAINALRDEQRRRTK